MSFRSPHDSPGNGFAERFTPAIRTLVIACMLVFLVQALFPRIGPRARATLRPRAGRPVRSMAPVAAAHLHVPARRPVSPPLQPARAGDVRREIEQRWGTFAFLRYYLVCGAGAGITQWLVGMHSTVPVIGASGAIFGVLLAYGLLFPDRQILLWFVIPIPARYLVVLFGFIELVGAAAGPADGVARFAHLGGLVTGLVYLKSETWAWPIRRRFGAIRKKQAEKATRAESEDREARQAVIDGILEKIQSEGMGALTEKEKKILHDAAQRGRRPKR
jgi:membrane associated rhomboid family serine protease